MAEQGQASTSGRTDAPLPLVIFILSGRNNYTRRKSLRNSWFKYLTSADSPLEPNLRSAVRVYFVIAKSAAGGQAAGGHDLGAESCEHGDILELEAPEGYENLWRKALVFLEWLEGNVPYQYVMHADDDSFIRLDLLMPLVAGWPPKRFYFGYIWDGTGNRVTAPIRNPANKSHMPAEQYALDYYPPFASGCGFVLSRDLVQALLKQPLPDYRLLDPPFGIHLCGSDFCVLDEPVQAVHSELVRPYRPIPIFRPDTLVQHYLRPEEMKPFYEQALQSAREASGAASAQDQRAPGVHQSASSSDAPKELYDTLVAMGLLRR